MGDIESIPCVIVLQSGRVKSNNTYVLVLYIMDGLSQFDVVWFFKIDGRNSNTTYVLVLYKMD